MDKTLINSVINFLMILLFVIVGITCIGIDLFGIDLRSLRTIHNFSGALLTLFILIHITLHFNWFKLKFSKIR